MTQVLKIDSIKSTREENLLIEAICSHECFKERLEWLFTLAMQAKRSKCEDTINQLLDIIMVLSEEYIVCIEDEVIMFERSLTKLNEVMQ